MGRFFAALALFLAAAPVSAQTITITGTVSDSLGSSSSFSATVTALLTMGETAVLGTQDSSNANLLIAQQATLSQAATIQSMSFYATSAAGQLRLGLYDASGANGNPGKKIAETAAFAPVSGWNTRSVAVQATLAAGKYWLAYLPSNDGLGFVNGAGPGAVWYAYPFGTMPTTFAATVASGGVQWSMYATLLPASVGTFTIDTSVNPPGAGVITITPGP